MVKLPAGMDLPPIVSPREWEAAREELLVKEKELTRARDALAAERRRMPRMAVEKDYRFEGPNGSVGLGDLFEGRHQLIVYRFFYEPGVEGWPESGCPGCSCIADQITHPAHLNARDTTIVFVSRAPQENIERWRARMGWEDGRIFRTYLVNGRGDEALGGLWAYLDITALGRQEEWEDSPEGYPQTPPNEWYRRHDEYDQPAEEEAAASR
jgi:predicted dithiol-disulfide oxidoreductase (DUF899 family)